MKAKVERGEGFRGLLDYALGKDGGNGCEIIGGTMSGQTSRDLSSEFSLSRAARPDVKKPVWHTSLSLPPGEHLDSNRWAEIADDFMTGMDLADHQYVVIRHHDTDIDHIHIIGSRVALDGNLYHGAFDAKRAIRLTQELEERHGLTRTKGLDDGPAPKAKPTRNEIEQTVRTGDAPPRLMLQEIVDAALAEPGSVFDFMDRIEAAGAVARPNVAKTGKMNGFSFEYGGIPFKGSDLGKSYTWKGLQQRGVDYEQERDGEALRARAGGSDARAGEIDGGSAIALDRPAGSVGRGPDAAGRGAEDGRAPAGGVDEGRGPEGGTGHRESAEGDGVDIRARHGDVGADRGIPAGDAKSREIGGDAGGESVKKHSGTGDAPALDDHRHSGSVRPADWDGVADRTAHLAAGAYPDALEDRAGDPVSPAIEAKRRAWDAQHGALQSPAYRLTLKSRVDGLSSFNVGKERGVDGTEKTYDAAEVRALIPYLSAHNVRGRDIYLTPMDPDHHYMVVDDMTPTALEDFLAAGYAPALVQESSDGNRQAVLKVKKEQGRDEQKAGNAVVVDLNRRFGDPAFSGVIHPFRMAGFSNKKPGRGNAFTRILKAAGGICVRTMTQLGEIRQRLAGDRAPTLQIRTGIPRMQPITKPTPSSDVEVSFDRARRQSVGLAARMGWTRDESRLDHRAAQMMADEGWGADDIAAAILARSPNLMDRHRDPVGYAVRTAENAVISTEADPKPQGEQPPQAGDRPEEPGM